MQEKSELYIGETDETPLGRLWVAVSDGGLVAVNCGLNQEDFTAWLVRRFKRPVELAPERVSSFGSQLENFLSGRQQTFSLAIDWSVLRPFQQAALQATYEVPYGEVRTYKEIAGQIGRPNAARAVGRAEATNPMPLVIPCHRVIGTDGKLHGYGMGQGIKTKEWLLKMEGSLMT